MRGYPVENVALSLLPSARPPRRAELNDETLRDGVQSPSVRHPNLQAKRHALVLMERLGMASASLGLPAAGPTQKADVEVLLRDIVEQKLSILPHCAGRAFVDDLRPVADIAQTVGASLTVYAFIGSSPIRRFAEGWCLDDILRGTEAAFAFAAREGLDVAFVTEDTTRSRPEDLERLFLHAIGLGARRLVLCDTVGHATPEGARALVRFARRVARRSGEAVALDWHGHDDRGLAVANTLAAEAAGVDRIHGTMLGLGERCGNAALDALLRNRHEQLVDEEALESYRALVCNAYKWKMSPGYPWGPGRRAPPVRPWAAVGFEQRA